MTPHLPTTLLMSYPGAQLFPIEDGRFRKTDYRDSEHFRVTADFLRDPDRFFRHLFAD